MEYKRFTRIESDKEWVLDCEKCEHKRECTENGSTDENYQYCIERIGKRLAEIEDKIENGTLIELPCKVGDTAYYETFINSKSQGIKPHKVIGFVLEVITQDIGGFGCTAVPIKDFGEDVFLTREEAEKRLKEIQE